MTMVVKNNIPAMLALGTLNKNSNALSKSLKKVSSGERVTSAEDDASSWGISERMRVRIRALDQANQNAQNDNSLMQTAEGALNSTLDILRSLKEKAINSATTPTPTTTAEFCRKNSTSLSTRLTTTHLSRSTENF